MITDIWDYVEKQTFCQVYQVHHLHTQTHKFKYCVWQLIYEIRLKNKTANYGDHSGIPHLNLAHSTFLEFGEIKAIQGIGE